MLEKKLPQIGVCMNLEDVDTIASNHRGHGHCIAKGCDTTIMMKELYGKKDGILRGQRWLHAHC